MWAFQIYGDGNIYIISITVVEYFYKGKFYKLTIDLVPDFVTIGKSMGNGHPVSCLLTSRSLADKFGSTGLQYFNTYGGNPVSMAAAGAVLDVIENEKLYTHVTEVSTYMLRELNRLKDKHEIIGDVR
jgi:4-aminobutyrate aminotransferase-like enzyme